MAVTWTNFEEPKKQFLNSDGRIGFFWQIYGDDVETGTELELDLDDSLERFDIIMLEAIIIEAGAATTLQPDLLRYSGADKVAITGTTPASATVRNIGPVPVTLSEMQRKLIIKPNPDATVDRIVIELTILKEFRSI